MSSGNGPRTPTALPQPNRAPTTTWHPSRGVVSVGLWLALASCMGMRAAPPGHRAAYAVAAAGAEQVFQA